MIRTIKIRIKGRKEGGAALGALPAPRVHVCAYMNKGMAGYTWFSSGWMQGAAGASAGVENFILPLEVLIVERDN